MAFRRAISGTCLLAAAILLLPAASCQSTPVAPGDRPGTGVDPFRPVALRVHPLSRIRHHESGETTIEACIELVDADGLPVRGLGVFDLVLHSGGPDDAATMIRRSWTCDVSSRQGNTQRFDSMAHTYLISLELDRTWLPPTARLDVTFRGTNGSRLSGAGKLESSGTPPSGPAPIDPGS